MEIRDLFSRSIDEAIEAVESLGKLILTNKKIYLKEFDTVGLVGRLSSIKGIKRKYGGTLDSVLKKREEAKAQIDDFESLDEKMIEAEEEMIRLKESLSMTAKRLTEERKMTAKDLSRLTTEKLNFLNMKGSSLDFNLTEAGGFTPNGVDKVEILFSPNKGEKTLSIYKIASGGELSRVTLALYQIIGEKTESSCYIFDEIDSGIGGKTASCVAEALSSLSVSSQVLVVSHLPQITELGNRNIKVEKEELGGRTYTKIKALTETEKSEELTRMRYGSSKK
jgi:DNA repair protein RecN (Recombination protein N)